jgi:hypothetical protein
MQVEPNFVKRFGSVEHQALFCEDVTRSHVDRSLHCRAEHCQLQKINRAVEIEVGVATMKKNINTGSCEAQTPDATGEGWGDN